MSAPVAPVAVAAPQAPVVEASLNAAASFDGSSSDVHPSSAASSAASSSAPSAAKSRRRQKAQHDEDDKEFVLHHKGQQDEGGDDLLGILSVAAAAIADDNNAHNDQQQNGRQAVLDGVGKHDDRTMTLDRINALLEAQVVHIANKVIAKVNKSRFTAGKLSSFSSRMRGCLRAAGRGTIIIKKLRASKLPLTRENVDELLNKCAPPTSTRPASDAASYINLYQNTQTLAPKIEDVDKAWIDLIPATLYDSFRETSAILPGKWIRSFASATAPGPYNPPSYTSHFIQQQQQQQQQHLVAIPPGVEASIAAAQAAQTANGLLAHYMRHTHADTLSSLSTSTIKMPMPAMSSSLAAAAAGEVASSAAASKTAPTEHAAEINPNNVIVHIVASNELGNDEDDEVDEE